MLEYDPGQPLIAIHIPKTAGVAYRRIFQDWFGDGLIRHYFNEETSAMPPRYDLLDLHKKQPIAVFGHFNKKRQFGIEDYYSEVRQFITVLRDPFERCVSGYFYLRKNYKQFKGRSVMPAGSLRDYVLSFGGNFLNHFPRTVTMDNYRDLIEEYFIEIGISEHLELSMKRIASKLGRTFRAESLERLNVTERDQETPDDLREEFAERHPIECAVYEYALDKLLQ